MGLYDSSNQPRKDREPQGSFREAMLITWVVVTVLAKPLGFLFGGISYLVLIFVLFNVHAAAGAAALALPFMVVVAWGLWEWRHPPELQ